MIFLIVLIIKFIKTIFLRISIGCSTFAADLKTIKIRKVMATTENKPRMRKKIEKQIDIFCFQIYVKLIIEQ